jgi:hypothetical protein
MGMSQGRWSMVRSVAILVGSHGGIVVTVELCAGWAGNFIAMDSGREHPFPFTRAMSLFMDWER